MRFLCLHGAGTNAEVFRAQLARSMHELREERHEFEFVEGDLACEAAEGIQLAFPEQTSFFQYFDPARPQTIVGAAEQLHSLLATESPPFDAVIGFSQGAMLAASILIDQSRHTQPLQSPALKCAVLICSLLPFDLQQARRIGIEQCKDYSISIPSLHIMGRRDQYYQEGAALSHAFDEAARQTYEHEGGHELPNRTTTFAESFAAGLRKCVLAANTRQ